MSLNSTDREQRVYYFKEKPSDNDYPYNETFYFKIVEYYIDDKTKEIEYVIIQRVSFVLENFAENNIRFTSPYILDSIKNAVRVHEKLKP